MKNKSLKKCNLTSKYLSLPLIIGSIILSGQSIAYADECSTDQAIIPEALSNQYRRTDGRQNNVEKPGWGAANKRLERVVRASKSRYPNAPSLTNPREISNKVSKQEGQDTRNAKGLSDLFWLWGQFLDHDITIVHTDEGNQADIPLPANEEEFTSSIPFSRSQTDSKGKQRNSLTSYIDGSNIYSASKATEDLLRAKDSQGNLTRKLAMNNGFLPKDAAGFYIAGDERANEHIGLTAMHTLWVREHNRIADAIACQHPNWNDEQLFQEAKRVVIAELQSITYNEFMPALIGENTLPGYWEYTNEQNPGYDTNVKANISHLFATSAFRFGHSMLSPLLLRLDKDGNEIEDGHVPLRSAFFQPDLLEENMVGIAPIFRGFAYQTAQALDPMVVDDIRNFLILSPGGSLGFDLAALNIQRGHDHKLKSYNDVRAALGLRRIDSFHDDIWREDFKARLADAYAHPDDVDPWVGGLAEKEVGNTLTGEMLQTILIEQFRRLRHGDNFWYEKHFYGDQLEELNTTTLADIIKRNTLIKKGEIQNNVFIATEEYDEYQSDNIRSADPSGFSAPAGLTIDPAEEIRKNRILEAIRNGHFG